MMKILTDFPTYTGNIIKSIATGTLSMHLAVKYSLWFNQLFEDNIAYQLTRNNHDLVIVVGENHWKEYLGNDIGETFQTNAETMHNFDDETFEDEKIQEYIKTRMHEKDWGLFVSH